MKKKIIKTFCAINFTILLMSFISCAGRNPVKGKTYSAYDIEIIPGDLYWKTPTTKKDCYCFIKFDESTYSLKTNRDGGNNRITGSQRPEFIYIENAPYKINSDRHEIELYTNDGHYYKTMMYKNDGSVIRFGSNYHSSLAVEETNICRTLEKTTVEFETLIKDE